MERSLLEIGTGSGVGVAMAVGLVVGAKGRVAEVGDGLEARLTLERGLDSYGQKLRML